MAIVNLATFEIDATKVQKEIDNLSKKLFDLTDRQKDLANQSKSLTKEINALGDITADNAADYDKLRKAQQEVFKSQQALAQETKVTRAEYTSLINVQRSRQKVENDMVDLQAKLNDALQQGNTTINAARAENSELIKLKNQLNPAIEEELALMNQLNERIDQNTQFIKDNSSSMEQQKMNIGNYPELFKESASELNVFNGGLGNFIQKANETGGAGKVISTSLTGMTAGMWGMVKASLAFIATGIGAIIVGLVATFMLLKNAMNNNSETANKMNVIFAKVGGVISGLMKVLEPLGTFVADVLVKAFDAWVGGVELAFNAVTGLTAAVLDFFGATEKADAVREFNKELKESAAMATEIFEAEQKAAKAQREAQKTMLLYQNEAEKLRQIRDDDSKSISERISANDALGVSLQKQMQIEKSLAAESLKLAQLRVKAAGGVAKANNELLDALSEAETAMIDIEERITGQMSEQLTNRNSLLKEAAEKAEETRQKAYEKELKRLQDELKLFEQQQGFKSKTLEEDLKIFEETSKRETDILKLQLKNRAISQTEFNAEMQRLQNEQGLKLAEIAVQNASLELDAYKRLNNEKYLENQRLNDELLSLENKRRSDILAADQDFAKLQLDQGIINKTEYDAQMLELETQFQESKRQLEKDYEATKREDEQLQRELDLESRLLALANDQWAGYEAEKINNDMIYEQRKIDLENQRQQGLISEENYLKSLENARKANAEADKQLAKAVQEYKLDIASQTFGNMATLLGKETAAGKAAAIAQTTIETYKSATSAYSSMASIPVVGPVLGAIAAAAAVASGLKTVKEITSVKTPNSGPIQGFATGGIVGDGFEIQRANGDNRLVTLQTEEAVLSRSSRSYMGDSMLAAAGVPMSGAASSTVGSSSPMMEEIALAVEQGAMRGSEQGSRSGSSEGIRRTAENRLVQQSATF